ncbi:hypothetical protein G3567_04915 [Psychroflexus sp. YR1-1]|uniref:Phosphopeptide-binding protein n=1 Tax=Psychroflexus aurantiacus TaxID=2709310 RepID=A0A6B3R6R1_9FLAO|nr:hypothetical protein [Psychroflexus aurantiacus]NEV93491.1 hypothetical protein [Psychroflexus aurantiacus]
MKTINLLTFAFSLLVLVGCKQDKKDSDEKMDAVGVTDTIVTITPLEQTSPKYPEATLTHPGGDVIEVPAGSVNFDFTVENYELGVQTENAGENGLANSGNGQHIHFILDNGPYSAHYESGFSKEIEEGEHVMLAFLSRSYHESVKNPTSFVVKKIVAGNPSEDQKMDVDFTAEHLFYSRPKGTYTGEDTKKVLLDFFLVGTEISQEGNKVKVTVNDGSDYLITEWVPHVIENMPMGENKIQLTLVDENLEPIPGPFNAVTRVITLEEAEEDM